MDIWIFQATFWEKLFFIGNFVGVSLFIYLVMNELKASKIRFWSWVNECKNNDWNNIRKDTENFLDIHPYYKAYMLLISGVCFLILFMRFG